MDRNITVHGKSTRLFSEAMERLSKRLSYETRYGRLSTDLQEATFEEPNHISFESTNLFKDLQDKFEIYKQRVPGKIKCYFFTSCNFSTVKYFFL